MAEVETPPPWVVALADQRLALMAEMIGPELRSSGHNLIMTPLTEPAEGASPEEFDRWDRTCDRCGRYCSPLEKFYTGHIQRKLHGVPVYLTFGACHTCKETE